MHYFSVVRYLVSFLSLALLQGLAFLLGLVLFLGSTSVQAQNFSFFGKAYDLDTGEWLYSETHHIVLSGQGDYLSAQVVYRYPDGKVIAQKNLDFSDSRLAPALTFLDRRDDSTLTTMTGPDSVELIKNTQQARTTENVEVEQAQALVVDAGFDQLVLENWDKLVAGEVISFDFLALSRASVVPFQVSRISDANTNADINANPGTTVTLAIEPESWLIGMLMDPIRLVYDRQTAKLLEYSGVTNIPASESGRVLDENYHARIRYRYGDAAQTSGELTDMSAHSDGAAGHYDSFENSNSAGNYDIAAFEHEAEFETKRETKYEKSE